MSSTTWTHAQLLIKGALLCQGPRQITAVLRVLGLQFEPRFEKFHRVLNRNRWSCAMGAKILLGLLIALLPSDWPILIAIDETIERRKGKKIQAKGYYRDAVRSSESNVVKCMGLKWICMAILVPLPWNKRPWALPFLTILAPSSRSNENNGRAHRTTVDWTKIMIRLVTRWLKKNWVLIGDGAYACISLGHACNKQGVTLTSRLRLDACLYDMPDAVPAGRKGRKPMKGKRIESLKDKALSSSEHDWSDISVRWYGGKEKALRIQTGINLWYKSGEKPLKIRWVLVANPEKPDEYEAFFSTDIHLSPKKIIEWFVLRWNIEVTFQEVRAHLGVETQRQWSDKAIGRTTPVLMALYSLTCAFAYEMRKTVEWHPAVAAWYDKGDQFTFSDTLAMVKRSIWSEKHFNDSTDSADVVKISKNDYDTLIRLVSEAA